MRFIMFNLKILANEFILTECDFSCFWYVHTTIAYLYPYAIFNIPANSATIVLPDYYWSNVIVFFFFLFVGKAGIDHIWDLAGQIWNTINRRITRCLPIDLVIAGNHGIVLVTYLRRWVRRKTSSRRVVIQSYSARFESSER